MSRHRRKKPADGLPLVLSAEDIAKVLRVSRNVAYEVIHQKGFPVFQVGKQYRISRERFIQWIEQAEQAS